MWGKVVNKQLIGEYRHTLDTKRRVFIPSSFRSSGIWIITTGFEDSLFLFPDYEWEKIREKIKNAPLTRKDARDFLRLFLSRARNLSSDSQGRILIPENLCEFSGISKHCVFVGILSRIEIWSPENWDKFINERSSDFSEMAENITSIDF